MSFLRTLRTVRHLRPDQVLWRLRYAAERRRNLRRGCGGTRWAWTGDAPPLVRSGLPELPCPRAPGPRGAKAVEMLTAGVVEHLNQVSEIGRETPDWRLGERAADRLWTVTLHYHAWAYSLAEAAAGRSGSATDVARRAAALFRHYVGDWVERCGLERPGSSALAWNSYAVATRLGWWIRSFLVARDEVFAGFPEFEDSFLRSSWQQAAYLADHLEWDVRANHLVRDLAGLALAGRFFGGESARRWLRTAGDLAVKHGTRQVLADGGHFERSPKYHLDVMEDLLQIAVLAEEDAVRAKLGGAWAAMAEWVAWMRHPDGATAHLNDGAVVSADDVEAHLRSGHRLGVRIDPGMRQGGRHFFETGLVVWHGEPWTIFFDVGPPGPEEQPGHSHADNLTLECSFQGRRLIVDPGTFGYDADEVRRYDRSTDAHNTVAVDGQNSSEIWHIFRMGRRASPREVVVEVDEDGFRAQASHDGYDHLPGRPRHVRAVSLRASDGVLNLTDELQGTGSHRLRSGLLIEPSWKVREVSGGWAVSAADCRVSVILEGPDRLQRFVEVRRYHPDYGVERKATRLGWRWRGDLPCRVRLTLAAER